MTIFRGTVVDFKRDPFNLLGENKRNKEFVFPIWNIHDRKIF